MQCKKRKEMEMAQEKNNRKQTKKRAKIAVPAREQSLRYEIWLFHGFSNSLDTLKDSTYKNKHVTVSPH